VKSVPTLGRDRVVNGGILHLIVIYDGLTCTQREQTTLARRRSLVGMRCDVQPSVLLLVRYEVELIAASSTVDCRLSCRYGSVIVSYVVDRDRLDLTTTSFDIRARCVVVIDV
jgi:hypothetical protein